MDVKPDPDRGFKRRELFRRRVLVTYIVALVAAAVAGGIEIKRYADSQRERAFLASIPSSVDAIQNRLGAPIATPVAVPTTGATAAPSPAATSTVPSALGTEPPARVLSEYAESGSPDAIAVLVRTYAHSDGDVKESLDDGLFAVADKHPSEFVKAVVALRPEERTSIASSLSLWCLGPSAITSAVPADDAERAVVAGIVATTKRCQK
jgi:hypothetical protein